jgi:hypothetical protein
MFIFDDKDALGSVSSVDTSTVIVQVGDIERLRRVQVNRLVALHCSRAGQHLIGVVTRITRQALEAPTDEGTEPIENNTVKVMLIGTLHNKIGLVSNVFRRTIESVPEIDANCFSLEGDDLTNFMRVISSVQGDGARLSLGNFTLDDEAEAFLNGNKLFQRHALVVGSTGSGKSWTTAVS